MGKILSRNGYRDKVKLATKLPHWKTTSLEDMNKVFDEQLGKLQTDHIDYYLVHGLTGTSWERGKKIGVIDFLNSTLESGKILNAGFSFHGATKDFNTIVDDYDWTFCQIQYNILDTKNQAGTAGLKYASSKNMAVMVMEPLRGGNLVRTPPEEVQKIWDSSNNIWTAVEWSLRWILNHPEVTVVLSGMNNEDHIRENIRIASEAQANSFNEQDLAMVSEAADTYRRLMKAGCTGCQYCMPCPAGVNIPSCFEYYNSYHMFRDKMAKLIYMVGLGGAMDSKIALASLCIECRECVEKCPQGLEIPDLLKDVKKDMEGILTKPTVWVVKKLMKVKY